MSRAMLELKDVVGFSLYGIVGLSSSGLGDGDTTSAGVTRGEAAQPQCLERMYSARNSWHKACAPTEMGDLEQSLGAASLGRHFWGNAYLRINLHRGLRLIFCKYLSASINKQTPHFVVVHKA